MFPSNKLHVGQVLPVAESELWRIESRGIAVSEGQGETGGETVGGGNRRP